MERLPLHIRKANNLECGDPAPPLLSRHIQDRCEKATRRRHAFSNAQMFHGFCFFPETRDPKPETRRFNLLIRNLKFDILFSSAGAGSPASRAAPGRRTPKFLNTFHNPLWEAAS